MQGTKEPWGSLHLHIQVTSSTKLPDLQWQRQVTQKFYASDVTFVDSRLVKLNNHKVKNQ